MKLVQQQKGITLAISLMLLFLITLIGVSSIRTTHMQEKMSHHTQDKMISFQAAETALIGAETLLAGLEQEVIPTDLGGCPNATVNGSDFCIVQYTNDLLPEETTDAWWTSNGSTHSIDYPTSVKSQHQVNSQPLYYIEYLHFVPDNIAIGKSAQSGNYFYRVFSRGKGATSNSTTILETTFTRRY